NAGGGSDCHRTAHPSDAGMVGHMRTAMVRGLAPLGRWQDEKFRPRLQDHRVDGSRIREPPKTSGEKRASLEASPRAPYVGRIRIDGNKWPQLLSIQRTRLH